MRVCMHGQAELEAEGCEDAREAEVEAEAEADLDAVDLVLDASRSPALAHPLDAAAASWAASPVALGRSAAARHRAYPSPGTPQVAVHDQGAARSGAAACRSA